MSWNRWSNDPDSESNPFDSPWRRPAASSDDPYAPLSDEYGTVIDAESTKLAHRAAGEALSGVEGAVQLDGEKRALTDAFRGSGAAARIAATHRALDRALVQWWSDGELPPPALLRDGLLLLEAGHSIGESQRTLLLRTALAYRRGMVTALGHQTDPERTGYLLAEALTTADPARPDALTAARIQRLLWEDPAGADWLPYLQYEIADWAESDLTRPELAGAVAALSLERMVSAPPPAQPPPVRRGDRIAAADAVFPRNWIRIALLALAILILGGMLFGHQVRVRAREAVTVPGATYRIANASGNVQEVILEPYIIDRYEVSVDEYRRCYGAGVCPWPEENASATRADYLTNRTFNQYPMIRVDWGAAAAYCSWAGMRLPTAEEWQVAASYAPMTDRYYRYPWGDTPELQLANSLVTGQGDTQAAGLYHPFGSSPMGMADAAGNVAEWTASAAGNGGYQVKGGSFLDEPEQLAVAGMNAQPADTAAPWLGFRCAASPQ